MGDFCTWEELGLLTPNNSTGILSSCVDILEDVIFWYHGSLYEGDYDI